MRTYEELLPWIERCLAGEADVLVPGLIDCFAVSSGTTAGGSKYLPITRGMERGFRRGGLDALYLHVARAGRASIFGGRQLFLGGSTGLDPAGSDPRLKAGDLSGIMARRLPRLIERWFYSPGRDLALLTSWQEKIEAIAARVVDQDVRVVAGIPTWCLVLFEAVREEWRRRHGAFGSLAEVWPGLELVVHGGVGFEPYRPHFARWLDGAAAYQEVYPASEGFFGVQDRESGEGLRLLTDLGIFYELVPASEMGPGGTPPARESAVPIEGAETGVDYALVVTTPGGLWRHWVGDVVRFVDLSPPRLLVVGRTRLELSAFGEHVIEHEVVQALSEVAAEHRLLVRDFTVAPLFPCPERPEDRGRHQWLIELGEAPRGESEEELAADLAELLDLRLDRANDDYRAKRRGGGLAPPEVRLLPRGAFHAWLARGGKLGGQHKVPRLASHRGVADQVLKAAADLVALPAQFA